MKSTKKYCRFFFFTFLFSNFLFSEEIVLFSPPSNWQYVAPKDPSEYLRIAFVGTGKNPFFHPSINLATEEADIPLKEYVQAVKKIHQTDPLIQIRDLGNISCKIGPAHLLELSTKTPYGEVRILQFLTVYQKTAYVLTGSILKNETTNFYSDILKSFHSFNVIDDLFSLLSQEEKTILEKKIQKLKNCSLDEQKKAKENFQTFVFNTYKEQGSYWQLLLLKKIDEELKTTPAIKK